MGFHSAGQTSLKCNRSLRRSNRRLFLDKENKYSHGNKDNRAAEIFRHALEDENKVYWMKRFETQAIDSIIRRVGIAIAISVLILVAYHFLI